MITVLLCTVYFKCWKTMGIFQADASSLCTALGGDHNKDSFQVVDPLSYCSSQKQKYILLVHNLQMFLYKIPPGLTYAD